MTTKMDDLADAAVETAEGDVVHVEAPDFAAVLARAQGIRAEAAASEPATRRDDEVVLRPFVIAAVAQAEADVAVMLLHGPPEEPVRPAGKWKWIVGIGAAVAAAAAAVLATTPFGSSLEARDADADASQAVSAVEAAGAEPEPFQTKQPPPRKVERPRPPAPEEEVAIEPEPEPPPPPESVDDRLRKLDALAAKQLGEGQTDAADRTLSQLIEIGGKRRLVELAFGDRFTIAHRRGDSKRQVALWQSYLRRFPRGKFADDARAGICRHASEKRRAACWREYLRDFPGGAYSELARRESGPDAP